MRPIAPISPISHISPIPPDSIVPGIPLHPAIPDHPAVPRRFATPMIALRGSLLLPLLLAVGPLGLAGCTSTTSTPVDLLQVFDGCTPGAKEECNGRDDDCDGEIDEDLEFKKYYTDGDGDGYGVDGDGTKSSCKPIAGMADRSGDCNDKDAAIHPGAAEKCNKVDENCNAFADEGLPMGAFFKDGDGDGFGSSATVQDCAAPPGFVDKAGDCNDNNAAINPAAPEQCNEVDDNCNGVPDDGFPRKTFFKDNDGDNYGGTSSIVTCSAPSGYVEDGGDCNDYNKNIHPKATEQCNGADDDCNGLPDDNLQDQTSYKDNDGDGFAPANAASQKKCDVPVGWVLPKDVTGDGKNDWDCDDSDVNVYPAAPDRCGDNKDNDCDGTIDRLCFASCAGQWRTAPFKLTNTFGITAVSTIDLDGDSNHEIVVQDEAGFAILDAQGKPLHNYSAPNYNYSRRQSLVADIDNYDSFSPGIQTLEVLTGNGSQPRYYKLNADGTVTTIVNADTIYDASTFLSRDLDNDGTTEFISTSWCNPTQGVMVYRYDRAANQIVRVTTIPDGKSTCEYTAGRLLTDLDGDGKPEIVFGNGYAVGTDPSYWGGKIYAKRFTDLKTLANADFCGGGGCFDTEIASLFPGYVNTPIIRVGDTLRTDILYFSSNTPNMSNPSTWRYWEYDLTGTPLAGIPSTSSGLWSKTTDVDRDGAGDDFGSYVASFGLYDVNGDGFPDRIYAAGNELRVDLWSPKDKQFREYPESRFEVSAKGVAARAAWDINGDGRIDVISSDTLGNIYCHSLGKATFSKANSLPPRIPMFARTWQWDNYEPNEGGDPSGDGLPDEFVRVPSALTAKGDFHAYLSSANDKDYYLIDADWSARICLSPPKGVNLKLRIFSYSDRFDNGTKDSGSDGKPDGLVWEGNAMGQDVCFSSGVTIPARSGEFKFVIGVESIGGSHSPWWPYWITATK